MNRTVAHGGLTDGVVGRELTLVVHATIVRATVVVVAIESRCAARTGRPVAAEIVGAIIGTALLRDLARLAILSFGLTSLTTTIIAGGTVRIVCAEAATGRLVLALQAARTNNGSPSLITKPTPVTRHWSRNDVPRTGRRRALRSRGSIAHLTTIRRTRIGLACVGSGTRHGASAIDTGPQIAIRGCGIGEPIAAGGHTQLIVKRVCTLERTGARIRRASV